MYTDKVTEIIDDLMFDERLPDRESMRQEGMKNTLIIYRILSVKMMTLMK